MCTLFLSMRRHMQKVACGRLREGRGMAMQVQASVGRY